EDRVDADLLRALALATRAEAPRVAGSGGESIGCRGKAIRDVRARAVLGRNAPTVATWSALASLLFSTGLVSSPSDTRSSSRGLPHTLRAHRLQPSRGHETVSVLD